MPADGQLFRVLLRLQINQGMARDFEQTWPRIGNAVTAHPANRGQWLLRGADEPATYYIMSDWTDEDQFRAFEHSPAHLEHRKLLGRYRCAVSMTTMHVVYNLPAGTVIDCAASEDAGGERGCRGEDAGASEDAAAPRPTGMTAGTRAAAGTGAEAGTGAAVGAGAAAR
jgi:heme-degrading monooxygenase HmoA